MPYGDSEEEEVGGKAKTDNGVRRVVKGQSALFPEKTGQIRQRCLNNETPVDPPFWRIIITAAWLLEKSI